MSDYCKSCGQWPTHKSGCPNFPDFSPSKGQLKDKVRALEAKVAELEDNEKGYQDRIAAVLSVHDMLENSVVELERENIALKEWKDLSSEAVTIDGQTFVVSGAVSKLMILISTERDELKAKVAELEALQSNQKKVLLGLKDQLEVSEARVLALQDFAIWLTGCGYDFCQHDYFIEQRDKLLSDKPDKDSEVE